MTQLPNITGYTLYHKTEEEIVYKRDILYVPTSIKIRKLCSEELVLCINNKQYIHAINNHFNVISYSPEYIETHTVRYKLVKCSKDKLVQGDIIFLSELYSNIEELNSYGICINNCKNIVRIEINNKCNFTNIFIKDFNQFLLDSYYKVEMV